MNKRLIDAGVLTFLIFLILGTYSTTNSSNLQQEIADTSTVEAKKTEDVEIVSAVDGDTVKVKLNGSTETIRLLLVDTPETVHPNKEPQPFGKDASIYTKSYLKEGMTVQLEIGNPERDNYNRLLGYIWVDGVLFNQVLVEQGYARVGYIYPPNVKYLEQLLKAQEKAKEKKKGIWSIDGYVTDEGFSQFN